MRSLMTFLLAITAFSFIQAQTSVSEGYISYSISIDSDEPAASLLAMGASIELAFKDGRTKIIGSVSGGNTVSVVGLHGSKTGLALMSVLGEKKAVKLTSKEFDKAMKDLDKIGDNPMRYTEDTKEIAGYTCKKVYMKHRESGANVILYLTDKINPKGDPLAKKLVGQIKGFPLGIVVRKDDTIVRLTANKVSSRAPSSSIFSLVVPGDYELTTFDDLEDAAKEKIEEKR